MAGTYLQQDVYGSIAGAVPLFQADRMHDQELLDLVRATPAVERARKHCGWIVATSLYQPKRGALQVPNTTTPECWLAFVDREEHSTPGWTKVPLVLFDSYERNENVFKVILPAVLRTPLVFVNHALPQARCLSLAHLIRGKELAKGAEHQPHLLASKIPSWSGRAVLPGQLEMTRGFLERRNVSTDLADFVDTQSRMERVGFNTSLRLPVTDTLWMIWPTGDEVAEKMSRLWTHEVARFSSFEKVSYAWVVSQVPAFRPRLTDAVYIYSPEQRCGWTSGGNASGGRARKARSKVKRRLTHAGRSARRLLGRSVRREAEGTG